MSFRLARRHLGNSSEPYERSGLVRISCSELMAENYRAAKTLMLLEALGSL